jgi:hypothetical protein
MARQRTKIVNHAASASVGPAASGPVEAQEPVDSSSIAALAYQLWHARGCPHGSPETDWFQAEQELIGQSLKSKSLSTEQSLLIRQVGA